MREREVEAYLVAQVELAGGKAWKWVSPGWAGVPDRIVVLPFGRIAFVEVKRPGGRVRALQRLVLTSLAMLGQAARTVDSFEEVDRLVAELRVARPKTGVCPHCGGQAGEGGQ